MTIVIECDGCLMDPTDECYCPDCYFGFIEEKDDEIEDLKQQIWDLEDEISKV